MSMEKETIEAFTFWREKQLLIATDPKVIDDLNTLTVEVWIKRILRPPVYETLGQKRADIKNPYIIPVFPIDGGR